MNTKHITISGDRWLHHDEPDKAFASLTVATCIAALISVFVLRPDTEAILGTLLLVTLVTLAALLTRTATTRIEIDREKGEVRKTKKYLAVLLRRSAPLRDFDSIVLLTQDEPAEAGYRVRRFTVALSGKGRSLELLSADSEAEGKTIQRDLAEFLRLPAREEAGGSPKAWRGTPR